MNPIEKLMGLIMNGIYEMLYFIGVHDVGWNIVLSTILFTILIYMLLLPSTIKQQKFSRISAVMTPEIQEIQNKYKGKTDQASMMKMQEETKAVYKKYGSSPMSGCLGSLIQLPFLFAYSANKSPDKSTSTFGISAVTRLISATRSSWVNIGFLPALTITQTINLSKIFAAR